MATKIISGNHSDSLQGSQEKRIDVAPDGTIWAALVVAGNPGKLKFFRSTNGGSTWIYASGSDISLDQNSAVPSFYIDADGYAHVSWVAWARDPQVVMYARGAPSGDRLWTWTRKSIAPASGRLGVDSDVVAFRSGGGWVAWVAWDMQSGYGLGGHTSRLRISTAGEIVVEESMSGPATGAVSTYVGALEFAHSGNGKTPSANPNLFHLTFNQGGTGPIQIHRAIASSGSWTWEKPVIADPAARIVQTTLTHVYDGQRLCVAYSSDRSSTIKFIEWTQGSTTVVKRNPPPPPAGVGAVLGLSISCDPRTSDIHLVFYDEALGEIQYSTLNRAQNTWSPWGVVINQAPPNVDGKVQLVRHPPRDSIDMLYGQGRDHAWEIYWSQLTTLTRAPRPPILISPISGATLDLAMGYTFEWEYSPVSPADKQQQWCFRRVSVASGLIDYWNASTRTWSTAEVFNVGQSSTVTFPADAWRNGESYRWSVKARSTTGLDSQWSTERAVIATKAPVVKIISPSGIVYGESTPIVEWEYIGSEAQRSYEVALFTDRQVAIAGFNPDSPAAIWRSGAVSSSVARSMRVGVALDDAAGYRIFVRSTSLLGVNSNWASSQFTVSIAPPAGPVVELRERIEWETKCPHVKIDILTQSNFMGAGQALGQESDNESRGWGEQWQSTETPGWGEAWGKSWGGGSSKGGWIADSNVQLSSQVDDSAAQLLPSLRMESADSGMISALSERGTPPMAPFGRPQPKGPLDWPVRPGHAYTALASFKGQGEARAARVVIRWFDADDGTGALLGESVGEQVATGSTAYTPAYVTGIAPPRAQLARVCLQILGPTAGGEVFWATRMSFAPGRRRDWTVGGYAQTQIVVVDRSLDGGETWARLPFGRVKTDLHQRATIIDRTMPYRTDVRYRAATLVDLGQAVISSDWSLISTINVNSHAWWTIRDPSDPTAEMNAIVIEFEESDDESSSVHRPAGRLNPVVDTEGLHAATGSLTLFVKSGDIDIAKSVLRRTVPMILQSPNGRTMLVRITQRDYDVESLRHRHVKLRFIEVGATL